MEVCWLAQDGADVPDGDQWLGWSERAVLASLRIPKRRADWRLGRWAAKCAVAGYLKLGRELETLAAVELRPAPSGVPLAFLHGCAAPVALSLGHSGGIGLCAIAPAGVDVGCDVETVERRSDAFLADYFTEEERMLVEETPDGGRDRVLTLLWSAKESALKAMGSGLRLDTRSVSARPAEFLAAGCEEWRPLSVAHDGGRVFYGWWREARGAVWTVVAAPAALRLIELES